MYQVFDAEIEDFVSCKLATKSEAETVRKEYMDLWGMAKKQRELVTIKKVK